MKIHSVSQDSQKWLDLRKGKITASEIGDFATAEKSCKLTIPLIQKELDRLGIEFENAKSKEALKALCPDSFVQRHLRHTQKTIDVRASLYAAKIAELSGAEMPDNFETFAMRRGTELEPEARRAYEAVTGHRVRQVGFIEHDNGLCGCSPDGLIGDSGMVEIKCHMPAKHVEYLLDRQKFLAKHRNQIHFQMAIAQIQYVDLFGYCPGLPHILMHVRRNHYTLRMEQAIEELCQEYQASIDQYETIRINQAEALKPIDI